MSKKEKETAVAKVESAGEVTSVSDDFSQFEGQGLEKVTANDLVIPRITILQGLSPQVQPKKPEYIKGAKIGDICDIATGEIFEPPLLFLPVHFVKQWLEWAPRASGKGLIEIHNTNEILEKTKPDEKNRPVLENGNYISETAQFFGLNMSAEGRRCFLPMTSTQLKKSRKWLTLASSEKLTRPDGSTFTPPLYYRLYNLGVAEESNNEGDWVGWRVERGPSLPEYDPKHWKKILDEALKFRESILAGEVRGDVADEHSAEASGDGAM